MVMSFEDANVIIGEDYHDEEFLEAFRNFGIVVTPIPICKSCIHRENCFINKRVGGVCKCNYFDRGE